MIEKLYDNINEPISKTGIKHTELTILSRYPLKDHYILIRYFNIHDQTPFSFK